jgi:ribosomal protein S21
MVINVKLVKNDRVDSGTLLKRFQKKMQESGVVPKVKSRKHFARSKSKLKIKKDRLVKLEAAKKYEHLKKMGKLQVRTFRPQAATPTIATVK